MRYDFLVAGRAWLDDFPGENISVDDGERVRRLGEDRGYGGFAGRD